MGQYWKFFNLSMREVATPNGSDKLGTIAFVKQPFLVRSLAVPYTLPELAKYLANPPPPGRTAKKGLLSLPDEILTMLLESPETSYIETVYLAVTCKKLLSLACAQGAIISNTRDYYSASWAHCRIAAVGDEAHLDGMPDSVITPPMKEEIRDLLTTDHKYGVQGHLYAGLFLLNLQDPPCVNGLDRFYEDFRLRLSDADCRLVAAANAVTFPARDDWVLINVSKHEYVRAGAIAELCGRPADKQPFLPSCPLDLGTALMTRFCFSTSASISMYESDVKIHQGPWAGDRICITTIERAITPDPAYPWKDVTDEVIADIVTLYKANWEADWETEIKKFHGPFDYHWFSGDRGDGVDDHVPTQWQREYYRMHMQVA